MNAHLSIARLPDTLTWMTGPAPSGTLVFLPDLGGNVLYARNLVPNTADLVGCVGARLDSTLSAQLGRLTVPELGRRFAADIARAGLPRPVHLAGFSFAGFVAFETARHLASLGIAVKTLWLLDSAVLRKLPGLMLLRSPLAEARCALHHVLHNWRPLLGAQANPDILHRYGHVRMDLSLHPEGYRPIIRGLYRAMVHYHPEPWPEGRAVVIRGVENKGQRNMPDDLGWRQLIPSCEVTDVFGDHLSILRDPIAAAQVAAAMRLGLVAAPAGTTL